MDQNAFRNKRDILVQKITNLEAEYKSGRMSAEEKRNYITTIEQLKNELMMIQAQKTGAMSLHRQHGQLINRTRK